MFYFYHQCYRVLYNCYSKIYVPLLALHKKCPYSELVRCFFSAFGPSRKSCSVSLRIQSACGKMRTRITAKKDTFYVVWFIIIFFFMFNKILNISKYSIFNCFNFFCLKRNETEMLLVFFCSNL